MRLQFCAVHRCAVAAAEIEDFDLIVAQSDDRMAAADTHPITRIRRQIDIRHRPGRRIAPAYDRFLLGKEQNRGCRPFNLQPQHHILAENMASGAGDGGAQHFIGIRDAGLRWLARRQFSAQIAGHGRAFGFVELLRSDFNSGKTGVAVFTVCRA